MVWQSKRGVDIAVHITNRVIQVVGMSNMSADILCHYLFDVISNILLTVHQLSPKLAAAAYIVHLPKLAFLHEAVSNPPPRELFLVEDIQNSIAGHEDYTLSCKDIFGHSTRLPVSGLLGGWNPSLEDIERILWTQSEPSQPQLPDDPSKSTSTVASTIFRPTHTATATDPPASPTSVSADPSTPTAALHPSYLSSGAQALLDTSAVPTLSDVNELIVTQVAANWYNLALMLGVEVFLIDAVSKDHKSCIDACQDMLKRWLKEEKHTGKQERTWFTLLTALGRADSVELERSLRKEHFYELK